MIVCDRPSYSHLSCEFNLGGLLRDPFVFGLRVAVKVLLWQVVQVGAGWCLGLTVLAAWSFSLWWWIYLDLWCGFLNSALVMLPPHCRSDVDNLLGTMIRPLLIRPRVELGPRVPWRPEVSGSWRR